MAGDPWPAYPLVPFAQPMVCCAPQPFYGQQAFAGTIAFPPAFTSPPMISDDDVERIARRVVELLKGDAP